MKIKVTKKEILNGYKNIISVGYCNIAWLLKYTEPKFYTCGVYGWNADIYHIDNTTCIVTGYRPFGNIHASYSQITKKFDDKARKIACDYSLTWEQQAKKLEKLLNKFIKECLKIEE